MLRQTTRRLWQVLVLLAMAAPMALSSPAHAQSSGTPTTVTSNQTGTDPEPTEPDGGTVTSNQTGTDPEPTEPDVVAAAILALLLLG
jgi:hypothetical protein